MNERGESLVPSLETSQEQGLSVMERIFSAAQPGAVFGAAVSFGSYTVIPASEVSAGGGFGYGRGLGPVRQGSGAEAAEPGSQPSLSGGGGAGGGGGSSGRPVAVIIISPQGVTVQPVVDVTKIALAGITAWGAMFVMLRRLRKASRS